MDPGKIAAQRETITKRAETIDNESFFEVLGVQENAAPDVVQSAYFQLAKQFHPDRLPPQLADVREAAARCFGRMSEAFQTLSDLEKRSRYVEVLRGKSGAAEEKQVERIVQATLDFQKADVFLRKHELTMAEAFAQKACTNDPGQPEYQALLAWIQVCKAEKENRLSSSFAEPLRELTAAIDKESRCERALFYRAQLLKKLGKSEAALRDFRLVAELNPRNIDAAREVRLHEMRGDSPKKDAKDDNSKQAKSGLFGKLFKH